jgi:hypothetical protein
MNVVVSFVFKKQQCGNDAPFSSVLPGSEGFRFIWHQIKLIMVVVARKLCLAATCYVLLQFSAFHWSASS